MPTLAEIAVRFGCELRGDPDIVVTSVAPIGDARSGTITFLANNKLANLLASTRASAVVLNAAAADACAVAALVAPNPHATYARIAAWLYPAPNFTPGVHATAVVDPSATIDPSVGVGAHCVVGANVVVGARSFLGPHCILEDGAHIGADVRLVARVTLCHHISIGDRCTVLPGAVIGSDGFGYANERGTWVKVPQVGSVRIGNDVDVGANTTIDRGAMGDTVIEDGVKLDNQIQIGHNVRIGAHTAIAACVGVSGSATIGKRCMIGGAVGIVGHLSICDDVIVTGYTMISSSITEPGMYSSGIPAEAAADWRRIVGRLKRIDSLADRVRALEQDSAQGEKS
jgi:UDP-3-O-[3-hydroxymyristoyl] glucosamine N-acyltransferase